MAKDSKFLIDITERIKKAKVIGLTEPAKLILFGELTNAAVNGQITLNEAANLDKLMDFDRNIYVRDIELSGGYSYDNE